MGFLIVGGVWFWILTALIIVLLVWEVAGERAIAGGFTLLAYLLLIHLFGNASIFAAVKAHPEYAYIGIPAFFLIGAIWSLVKWWFFVKRSALEYRESRMAFLEANGVVGATLDTPVPENLKARAFARSRKPLARQNKGRIITWMVYWPFSMAWTLLDEPWRLIYEALARLFQRISDRIWADLDKDIKPAAMPFDPLADRGKQIPPPDEDEYPGVDQEGHRDKKPRGWQDS